MFVRADADNVIGRGHVGTGIFSQGYVAGTHGIEIQRTITNGRVLGSGGVGKERVNADGRVEGACGVGKESERSIGCVVRTGCVTQKRPGTSGCILVSGVGKERPGAGGRVELAFCVASERQKTDCCIEPAAVRLKSAACPSAVLPPGYPPSGAGTTACAIWNSARKPSAKKTRGNASHYGALG